MRKGKSTKPMRQVGPDVGGVHVAVVHAEHQDQHHLGDEQEAEEEGEPAQRLLAALLERQVEHLIDRLSQQIERRQHQDGREDRVEAERGVDDVGDVGADNDEGRVRDVDHVEHAERDRDADRHRRVEAAEQNARNDGVEQKVHAHHAHGRAGLAWLGVRPGTPLSSTAASTSAPPLSVAASAARLVCSLAAAIVQQGRRLGYPASRRWMRALAGQG